MGTKARVLVGAMALVVAFAGAVMAGTALEIRQPVQATVTVANLGENPSFDVIDNVFDEVSNAQAGAAAGYIDEQDRYVIGFGAGHPGGAWALKFGRSQSAKVGDDSDFVFKLKNNYANPLTVNLVEKTWWEAGRGQLGKGIVIHVVNAATDEPQWTLTGADPASKWTLEGEGLVLGSGEEATFYLTVENTNALAGDWNPQVRFEVTGD